MISDDSLRCYLMKVGTKGLAFLASPDFDDIDTNKRGDILVDCQD